MTTSLRCHDVNDDDDDYYYLFNCVFIYLFIHLFIHIYILHMSMGNSPKMAEDARLVN